MKTAHKLNAFLLIFSLVVFPAAPAFAQLGDVASPSVGASPALPVATEPVMGAIVPVDAAGPVISRVTSLSLGLGETTIAWTTDELATSRLEYGTAQSYGQNATLEASAFLVHTAILAGLTAGATYYYCIHATDLANNTSDSCDHSFTAAVESSSGDGISVVVDTTPPDISLVAIASISPDSITINWTTDSVSSSEIEYGTTAGYGEVTALDTSLVLDHSVTIAGLAPNTEYHYRIRTADEIGNTATSPDNTFTTASIAGGRLDVTAPSTSNNAILLISAVEIASISSSAVTIGWRTDVPSDSQIEYGESEDLGSLTTISTSLVTSHSVSIPNLSPNTNYIFRIKSKPAGAVAATASAYHDFSTLSHSTPVMAPANITSVGTSAITASGATVTWTTDKGATSQVEYGLSTSYGESSSFDSTRIIYHSTPLSDLDTGTTYHYRVKSVDEVGNITFSDDHAFATAAGSVPQQAPTALSMLVIGGYDQSSVDLTWRAVSENADSSFEYDIRYGTSPITEVNYANATQAQVTPVYRSDLDPEGAERNYTVAGLSSNTTYYFAVKSKHQAGDWSAISNLVSVKTTAGASVTNESAHAGGGLSAPQSSGGGGSYHVRQGYGSGSGGNAAFSFEPAMLKAEPANNQIIFQWNNPGEENFVRTVIVRKVGSYPTSPTDGQVIYEGRSETFTDTNVVSGKTYHYALYSYNHSKIYSAPVRVSLAPKAGNTQIKFNESGSLVSVLPVMHFVHSRKKGDTDIEIEHLQEILALESVSFPENMVTGYFGSITENALKRFQSKHGLSVTGIVDAATQAELNAVSQAEKNLQIPGDFVVFSTDLKFGDRGEAVKDLQEFLAHEGSYAEALVTGYFRSLTRKAVVMFQSKYGIKPVSGYVGFKTRHRMQQLTGL